MNRSAIKENEANALNDSLKRLVGLKKLSLNFMQGIGDTGLNVIKGALRRLCSLEDFFCVCVFQVD